MKTTSTVLSSILEKQNLWILRDRDPLNRYKQMAASRGTVTYYGAGPRILRILEMGGLGRLIRGLRTVKAHWEIYKSRRMEKVEGQKEQNGRTGQKEHVRLEFESCSKMKSLPELWQLYL